MSFVPPLSLQRLFWSLHSVTWDAGADTLSINRMLAWAAEHVPAGGAVIDLGCGTGRHALALARAGYSVAGLDFSGGMLRRASRKAAREQLPLTFRVADLNRPFPVPSNAFDGAVSISVLQCIADPAAFAAEVRRSLSIGGTFLLGVKANPGENVRTTGFLGALKRRASTAAFLHRFTPEGLRTLLLRSSLEPLGESVENDWIWIAAKAV